MSSLIIRVFVDRENRLHHGWWIAIFFAFLTGLLVPALLLSIQMRHELSVWEQALIIFAATLIVQALRKKAISEVVGHLNLSALRDLGAGLVLGFALMAAPAAVLWCAGYVQFSFAGSSPEGLISAIILMAGVAIAEELLFRGVIFQRLIAAVGEWPAQVAIGLLFVLTHLGNPGMDGATKLWAGANIFLASMLFSQAFLRSGGLALPIGLHFMANVVQGVVLGFGVSGNESASLLTPRFPNDVVLVTGGAFGLEASLPGLIAVFLMLGWFVFCNKKTVHRGTPGQHRGT